MLKGLSEVMDIYLRSRIHRRHSGSGNAVSASLLDDTSNKIMVTIQTKLTSSEVIGGRLVSAVEEMINPRGGKRIVGLEISYKEAVQLHEVLEDVLRDAKVRQKCQHMFGQDESSIENVFLDEGYSIQ